MFASHPWTILSLYACLVITARLAHCTTTNGITTSPQATDTATTAAEAGTVAPAAAGTVAPATAGTGAPAAATTVAIEPPTTVDGAAQSSNPGTTTGSSAAKPTTDNSGAAGLATTAESQVVTTTNMAATSTQPSSAATSPATPTPASAAGPETVCGVSVSDLNDDNICRTSESVRGPVPTTDLSKDRWVRVENEDGSCDQIVSFPEGKCVKPGAKYPYYLSAAPPTIDVYTAGEAELCLTDITQGSRVYLCCEGKVKVNIYNCNGFFVYKLGDVIKEYASGEVLVSKDGNVESDVDDRSPIDADAPLPVTDVTTPSSADDEDSTPLWIAILIIIGVTALIVLIALFGVWCYRATRSGGSGNLHKEPLVTVSNTETEAPSGVDNPALDVENNSKVNGDKAIEPGQAENAV